MQAQAHTVLGATRVNESTCDIHDVTRAASDLIAFGCTLGATQFFDSFMQIQFSSIVSSYANEIIAAVDEGIISAQEALQEIRLEYAELSAKVIFYGQNSVTVAAGAMQVQSGLSIIGTSRGASAMFGIPYVTHGVNNVYEGAANIYHGLGAPNAVGPVRKFYQMQFGSVQNGNIAYYSADLILSMHGMLKLVRRRDSTELLTYDPLNYEHAYKQMGKLTLAFEALVDALTITTLIDESKSAQLRQQTSEH